MARKNNRTSPYLSCRDNHFVVHENTFKIDEPRLRNSFGQVYDKTLAKNPVPGIAWRDVFAGATITAILSTIYAGSSLNPFSWAPLTLYLISDCTLFVVCLIIYGVQIHTRHRSRSPLEIRQSIIEEAFSEIVNISQNESQQ